MLFQILRWNWSRVVLALSFARSTAPMAFALRFSVLPLVDSIMHLAFEDGVEGTLSAEHAFDIRRSSINLGSFCSTKYFTGEAQRSSKDKSRVRKTPDS